MKAIVYERYGSPDVLRLAEVERPPTPADGEVLIEVHAVSLNDWDCGLLAGDAVNRLINGLARPKRRILGSDVAGRVEAVGPNVARLRPGDEVFGDLSSTWGGLAEYVCARETVLTPKAPSLGFVEAAAIPQAATLALQGLRHRGEIRSGQRILINGAGGGAGTFAIQLAKLFGATVDGIDHTAKLPLLRALGCEHAIDYTREDFAASGRTYDLVLDVKAKRSLADWSRVLVRGGRYVVLGGSNARLLQGLVLTPWLALRRRQRVRVVMLKLNQDLAYLGELCATRQVVPVIDGPYPLRAAADAFRRFAAGAHQGKIVLSVTDEATGRGAQSQSSVAPLASA